MAFEDAVVKAQNALFDYALLSPTARKLRNSPIPGAPFISFFLKSTGQIIEHMNTPKKAGEFALRLTPYFLATYAAQLAATELNDLEDDDAVKLRRLLPDHMKNSYHVIMLPWKDNEGGWHFVDFSYFVPWQQQQATMGWILQSIVKMDPKLLANIPGEIGVGQSPLLNLMSAFATNTDPWSKQPIMNDKLPGSMQAEQLLYYAWNFLSPSMLNVRPAWDRTAPGAIQKSYRGLSGYKDPRTGKEKYVPAWSPLVSLVGFNDTRIVPKIQRAFNLNYKAREIKAIEIELRKRLSDPNFTNEERKAMADDFKEKMLSKVEKAKEYAERTDVSPAALR
jgi:hypothetical protein